MTKLQRLYAEQGQSPWLDNLTRGYPIHDSAGGADGFVSVEVAPEPARDTQAMIGSARSLHEGIDQPNLSFRHMLAGLAAKARQLSPR